MCQDENAKKWPCGFAAEGALMQLLAQPGLSCEADSYDRFGRALADCSTTQVKDIAAALVGGGFAVSQEFNGIRDYGHEEDAARSAKRAIWRGPFTHPRKWRDMHNR